MKPHILFRDTPPATARNCYRRIAGYRPDRVTDREWTEPKARPRLEPADPGGLLVAALILACVLLGIGMALGLIWWLNN